MKNLTILLFLIIFPFLGMGFSENEAADIESQK